MDISLETIKWNVDRGNTKLDIELEDNMLDEEYQEFKDELTKYVQGNYTDVSVSIAEMIDAVCDFKFVLIGSRFKGYFTYDRELQLEYMNWVLSLAFKDNYVQWNIMNPSYDLVVKANNAKPNKKNTDGKVVKGTEWKDPKEGILELVRNSIEDTKEVLDRESKVYEQ